MKQEIKGGKFVGIIGTLLAALIMIILFNCNDHSYEVTVTGKERVHESESSKYIVFCEKGNGDVVVFENVDAPLRGKFNSSDIQGALKVGNKYEVSVVGYRIPFLSAYENIISFKEIETGR